jgi:pimeloyl-ACP methyl ester carboxylesterase
MNSLRQTNMDAHAGDAPPAATWRAVMSADGTAIGYLTTGSGPSVIVVPGTLEVAAEFASFAGLLGQGYTVHTIERRGRGLSGPQGDDYGMAKECEDIAAVRAATGSTLIFGHSYGGLIALEAARTSGGFGKVALYEPGVSVRGAIPMEWITPCQRLVAKGKHLDAFATFSVAAGPRQARRMPVWLMKRLLPLFIGAVEREQIFDLLPTSIIEHRVIGNLDNSYAGYQQVQADVLVMHGGKSGLDWVGPALSALADVLPSIIVREFPGLDHFGPTKRGAPEVAAIVRDFLAPLPPVHEPSADHRPTDFGHVANG